MVGAEFFGRAVFVEPGILEAFLNLVAPCGCCDRPLTVPCACVDEVKYFVALAPDKYVGEVSLDFDVDRFVDVSGRYLTSTSWAPC